MIVLDTNVISAVMRPADNAAPVEWLDMQAIDLIWTTSVTLFELRVGMLLLPQGQRRSGLIATLDAFLSAIDHRILPFDARAAENAAQIAADRTAKGRNLSDHDTQIGGIVVSRRAKLATRNIKDFDDLGFALIDPWAA